MYDADYARRHVLEQVLPFWRRHSVDTIEGGFMTCLDRRGDVYDTAKPAAMNARMVFAFSIGHELDPGGGHLDLARHGVDFLERTWDREHGGWPNLSNRDGSVREHGKRLFTQAYVLYGLAHYARVAEDGALLERLVDFYDLVEARAWDPVHSGYYASCNPDWSVKTDWKTICVQLDFMKVVHVLHELTGDSRFADRMSELADLVAFRMRDPGSGVVLEYFHRDWRYHPEPRRDTLELGHNLKAVRWLLETGDPRYLEAAQETLDFALTRGWDERHGGFWQHLRRSGRLAAKEKEWWAECEGLWALLLMHRETGDPVLLDRAQELMRFCFTHFADPEHGDWYMSCRRDGRPADERKGGIYKAAYHVVDACMAPISLLAREPSRAAAALA
jgi:N-acylglucosamine 2-epimerase